MGTSFSIRYNNNNFVNVKLLTLGEVGERESVVLAMIRVCV